MTKNEIEDLLNGVLATVDIEGKYRIEIKSGKRSLKANSYYHVLIKKISKVLKSSYPEVHLDMLRKYGETETDGNGNALILSVKSDIDMGSIHEYYDLMGRSILNQSDFCHYRILKGSSDMDVNQFTTLLDGTIGEAKELGIETMTPEELAKLEGYLKN